MKLSDIEFGEEFSYEIGGVMKNCIKSNRIEGGLRLCMTKKGEMLDLKDDLEVGFPLPALDETEKENKE